MLKITVQEAKEVCGIEQLYRGIEVGIEGVFHEMCLLWAQYYQEKDWGFLLIDA